MMKYRRLGKTNLEISAVSMGCWGISSAWGQSNEEQAIRTLRTALDRGINFFDTADGYGAGESELFIGKAFQGMRDKLFIATKAGYHVKITDSRTLMDCCDASLRRLKTDYIDLYQCHHHDPEHMDAFLAGFERLLEQGKIRHYGISTNRSDVLKRLNTDGKCSVCQLNFSLLDRSAEAHLLPYCLESDIGTLIRGPLHRGLLTGKYDESTSFSDDDHVRRCWNEGGEQRESYLRKIKYVAGLKELVPNVLSLADLALQFLLSYDAISAPITGIRTPEQAIVNAQSADKVVDQALLDELRNNRF